jgi:diguanylate cyclase (GGDEF)-like protein
LIVLVPMLALFLLLVFVSESEQEDQADARLRAAVETAVAVYSDRVAEAASRGRALAADPALTAGLEPGNRAALRAFARGALSPELAAVEIRDPQGEPLARAGSDLAIAFAEMTLQRGGSPAGTLRTSTTTAPEFAEEVKRLTGRDAVVIRDGAALAGTVEALPPPDEMSDAERELTVPGTTTDAELGGREYRARTQLLDSQDGESVLVLGPREEGGLLTVPSLGGALLLVLLLVATGVAYTMARTLTQLHDRVASEAITDPLTGLYNRRRLQESLSREVDRATRFGHELALLIVDVDEFKAINDTRGHPAGDAVLQAVSNTLREMTRTIDIGIRYGGDELAMIVIETGLDGGERLAERMRAGVAGLAIDAGSGGPVRATVSIGVAAVPDSAKEMEALVFAADQALLEAKRAGKNQIRTR